MITEQRPPRIVWAAHLLAILLSLALNLNLRSADQLGFQGDDFSHIGTFLDSERALRHNWRNLASYVLTDEPLFNLYHGLRYHWLGDNPRRHHLLQGLLLAANATLAFALVWRLSRRYLLSFVFLLLFLTYPNRGEACYWLAAIYVPMLLPLLAAAHLFLSWIESGARRAYIACWLSYSAAIFTHEAAFGFLAVFGGLWWLKRGSASWRGAARALTPLALSNAAYLVVRQTQWLGFGEPGFLHDRPLEPARVLANFLHVIDANFGDRFLTQSEHLLRAGSAAQSMVVPFLGVLGVLLAAAWLAGPAVAWRRRLEGVVLLMALVGVLALYTGQTPVPDAFLVMRWGLRAVVFTALGTLILARILAAPADAPLLRLGAFGILWFLAAYAPTLVLHVADRHSYIPSLGLGVTLACALWLPSSAMRDERRRGLLEGMAVALAAYMGVAFYGTALGERTWWVDAARFVSGLRSQMARARPSLPPQARVVVLDVPAVRNSVPLLASYALGTALRHWYRAPALPAASEFVARQKDFRFVHSKEPHHYEQLLLFAYKNEVLTPIGELVFEDGARVRLATAFGMTGGAWLAVRDGQWVGH